MSDKRYKEGTKIVEDGSEHPCNICRTVYGTGKPQQITPNYCFPWEQRIEEKDSGLSQVIMKSNPIFISNGSGGQVINRDYIRK